MLIIFNTEILLKLFPQNKKITNFRLIRQEDKKLMVNLVGSCPISNTQLNWFLIHVLLGSRKSWLRQRFWVIFLNRKIKVNSVLINENIFPFKIRYLTCIYICIAQQGLVLVGAESYVSEGSRCGQTKRYSKPTETTHQEPYHTLLRFGCYTALPIWLIHKYSTEIAWKGNNYINNKLLWCLCPVSFVIEIEIKKNVANERIKVFDNVWFSLHSFIRIAILDFVPTILITPNIRPCFDWMVRKLFL